MGLSYNKTELMRDIQQVFLTHNVSAIHVDKPGTLFQMHKDGSLTIGCAATIQAYPEPFKLRGIKGGRE